MDVEREQSFCWQRHKILLFQGRDDPLASHYRGALEIGLRVPLPLGAI